MRICILTESIKGFGLGHVVRCYNLAYKFAKIGYEVDLFIRGNANFKDFIDKQEIIKNIYPLSIQWEDIKNPFLLKSDICIIDSYEISDFSMFLQYAKILVIIDDDGRHLNFLTNTIENDVDKRSIFLLNMNGYYNTQTIKQNVLNNIFSGLEYATLNACFKDSKLDNIESKYDFFVCLGGEDAKDKSMTIAEQLQEQSNNTAIVVGANYKGRLLEHNTHIKNTKIYHNITQKEIALLMAASKNCIVSGGGIVFEALKLCKNVFAMNLASNQDKQLQILENQNLLKQIKLPIQEGTFKDIKQYNNIKDKISSNIDSMVSELAMLALNKNIEVIHDKKPKNFSLDNLHAINFCNISNKEIDDVLTYRNHKFVREQMYGNNIIDAKTHYSFIESLRNNEHSKYFLVKEDQCDIGVISLTRINIKHKQTYIGIYKNPLLDKHKSYGHLLMKMIKYIAFEHYNLNMLYLEVMATNQIAIKFYEKEGFGLFGRLENGFRIYENGDERFCDILIYGLRNNQ